MAPTRRPLARVSCSIPNSLPPDFIRYVSSLCICALSSCEMDDMVSYPSTYVGVNSGEQEGELLMVFPLLTALTATLYCHKTNSSSR